MCRSSLEKTWGLLAALHVSRSTLLYFHCSPVHWCRIVEHTCALQAMRDLWDGRIHFTIFTLNMLLVHAAYFLKALICFNSVNWADLYLYNARLHYMHCRRIFHSHASSHYNSFFLKISTTKNIDHQTLPTFLVTIVTSFRWTIQLHFHAWYRTLHRIYKSQCRAKPRQLPQISTALRRNMCDAYASPAAVCSAPISFNVVCQLPMR